MNEFSSKWIFHPFELGSKSTAMVELTAQPIYPFRQFCNRKCKLQRLYAGLCNYILSSVCREVHVWLPKGQEKGHFLFNANSFHGQNEVFFRSTVSFFFTKPKIEIIWWKVTSSINANYNKKDCIDNCITFANSFKEWFPFILSGNSLSCQLHLPFDHLTCLYKGSYWSRVGFSKN